jgi:hypothetical protein
MTRLPVSTPSFTVPSSQTGVFHVHAGPSRSSAALVVTSFMMEAGFTGRSACQASSGERRPTSCTTATRASRGTCARCSAWTTSRGRARDSALALGRKHGDAHTTTTDAHTRQMTRIEQ